jgi:hypothetical protein
VKRLQKNLRAQGLDVEVLNLGKPGWAPPGYSRTVKTVVPVFKPDMIIIGLNSGADIQEGYSPILFPLDQYGSLFTLFHHLVSRKTPPDGRSLVTTEEEHHEWYVQSAKDYLQHWGNEQRQRFETLEPIVKEAFTSGMINTSVIDTATTEPDFFVDAMDANKMRRGARATAGYMREIREYARRKGLSVLAVDLPTGCYVNEAANKNLRRIGFNTIPEMLTSPVPDQLLEKACHDAGMPFLCESEQFRQHGKETGLYFELDAHFTASGNALFADLITNDVAKAVRAVLDSRR